ncbi:MAG: transcriptional regulator NrdR [Chlamydiota bacterium]|nr:transcriptional regulator NrdR [Chlamydiota bacterium]
MRCPHCQADDLKVVDSREALEANAIRRRRSCLKCGSRFTTFETIDLNLQVKKRDGRFEEFSLDKLVRGIEMAARHTRISHDQIQGMASSLANELAFQNGAIPSLLLGERVMERLKELDPVAYVRYASVYRRFKDLGEVRHAIDSVVEKEVPCH